MGRMIKDRDFCGEEGAKERDRASNDWNEISH